MGGNPPPAATATRKRTKEYFPSPAREKFKGTMKEKCQEEPRSVPCPCLASEGAKRPGCWLAGLGSSVEIGVMNAAGGGKENSPLQKSASISDFLKRILPCGPHRKLRRKENRKGRKDKRRGGEIKSKLSSPLEEEMCISFL